MPYLSYCSEIWGNANKTNIDVLIKLQKRAIRLINKVGYREPTNKLFIQSNTLKFTDILCIKILEIMYRAFNKSLPSGIQKLFKLREGRYNLRGLFMFECGKERTNVKSRCVIKR